jgi:hypothetical protein
MTGLLPGESGLIVNKKAAKRKRYRLKKKAEKEAAAIAIRSDATNTVIVDDTKSTSSTGTIKAGGEVLSSKLTG